MRDSHFPRCAVRRLYSKKGFTRFDVDINARGHVTGKPAGIKEIGVEVAARKLFFPESLLRPYFSSE